MWAEAIFAKDDLARVVDELFPLRIKIGQDGQIDLVEARELELLPEVGLRMTVTPRIHWPILGVEIPVSLRSATLEVRPEIVDKAARSSLSFKLHLDDIDVSVFPTVIDRGIVELINKELDAKHVELSWDFMSTLSHVFELPDGVAAVGALDLRAASGRVKITNEAVALAVLFEAHGAPPPASPSRAIEPRPVTVPRTPVEASAPRTVLPFSRTLVAAAVLSFFAGVGLFALASPKRRPSTLSRSLRWLAS